MNASWNYGIVAFLDILGFSNLVESDVKSSTPEQMNRLLECMNNVRKATSTESIDVRSFSDSIILSSPLTAKNVEAVIRSVRKLQGSFVSSEFLIRGAIAYGKHYIDSESIYSEALVKAYRIERDHARFPRVIIEDDLIDWYSNDPNTTTVEQDRITSTLLKDRDNMVFVDYFDESHAEHHKRIIDKCHINNLSASILEKLQWLATYHNYKCSGLDTKLGITGYLVDGFKLLIK